VELKMNAPASALYMKEKPFLLSVETIWDTKLTRRLISLRGMLFVVGSPKAGCRIVEASQKILSPGNSMGLEFRPLELTLPKGRRPSRLKTRLVLAAPRLIRIRGRFPTAH
jgi:hypothetical protein